MKLSFALVPAMLAIAPAFASPVPINGQNGEATELSKQSKRQDASITCGTNVYTTDMQNMTYNYAQELERTRTIIDNYPHTYYKRDVLVNLPLCSGIPAPFREFPILPTGVLFTAGNNPLQDRLVYKITANDPASGLPDNFAYCGLITHTGAPERNWFVDCN